MSRLGIIGATGFIGQALIRDSQSRAIEVVATHRRPLTAYLAAMKHCRWQSMDIFDTPSPALFADCEWVICLAGTAHVQADSAIYQREVAAYQHLFDHLFALNKRVLYISSAKAEDGSDAYSCAKREIEQHLLNHSSDGWVVLRPALVYGAEMKGFLAQWARALASGWMPRLPEIANQRSLLSIVNLLSAIRFVTEKPACLRRIFTVTDTSAYSTSELQEKLMHAVGRQWRLPAMPEYCWRLLASMGDFLPLPFNSAHYVRLFADANYQHDELTQLGWQPTENFAEFCQSYRPC